MTTDDRTYIFPIFTSIEIIYDQDGNPGVMIHYNNMFGKKTQNIFHNCVMALLQPKSFMNSLSHSMGFLETSTPSTQKFKPNKPKGKKIIVKREKEKQ